MLARVPIEDIVPNPYQARKKMNPESVRALAEEIKEFGLWPGALRGRMRDGKVELCYGHRRLEALKVLGWQEVDVEIVDLSDDDMALQSLAENLQREGLTDIEKADAISMMIKRLVKKGMGEQLALQRVCKLVSLSEAWVKDLLSLKTLAPEVQKAIRKKKIAGRTALEAHRLGGKEMVSTAAKKKLAVHTISQIHQRIRRVPDEKVREKIRKEVIRGKVSKPEDVDTLARKYLAGRKIKTPDNLDVLVESFVESMEDWSQRVNEILPFCRSIEENPKLAAKVSRSLDKLLKNLARLTLNGAAKKKTVVSRSS